MTDPQLGAGVHHVIVDTDGLDSHHPDGGGGGGDQLSVVTPATPSASSSLPQPQSVQSLQSLQSLAQRLGASGSLDAAASRPSPTSSITSNNQPQQQQQQQQQQTSQPQSQPQPQPQPQPPQQPPQQPPPPPPTQITTQQFNQIPHPNSPLPPHLAQQFIARFRRPPPATHAQLQAFLQVHTNMARERMQQQVQQQQSGVGIQGGGGAGILQPQSQESQQQQISNQYGISTNGTYGNIQVVSSPSSGLDQNQSLNSISNQSIGSSQPDVQQQQQQQQQQSPNTTAYQSDYTNNNTTTTTTTPQPPIQFQQSQSSHLMNVNGQGSAENGQLTFGQSYNPMVQQNQQQQVQQGQQQSQQQQAQQVTGINFNGMAFNGQLPPGLDRESIVRQMRALQDSQATRTISGGSNLPHMTTTSSVASVSSPRPSNPATPQNQAPTPDNNNSTNMVDSPAPVGAPTPSSSEQAQTPGHLANPLLPFLPNGGTNVAGNMSVDAIQQNTRLKEAQAAKAKLAMAMAGRSTTVPMTVDTATTTTTTTTTGSASDDAVHHPSNIQTPVSTSNTGTRSNFNPMAFLAGLARHLQQSGVPLPPSVFVNEPAREDIPGSTPTPPGQMDVFGRKLDFMKLAALVTQRGGVTAITANNAWSSIAQIYNFPDPFPSPLPLPRQVGEAPDAPERTTTSAGEFIQVIFNTYLAGFIQVWVEAAQRRMKAAATGQTMTGQAQGAPTPTAQASSPQASQPSSQNTGPSRMTAGPYSNAAAMSQQPLVQSVPYNPVQQNGAYGNVYQGNQAFGLQHTAQTHGGPFTDGGMQQAQNSAAASPVPRPTSPASSSKTGLVTKDKKRKKPNKKDLAVLALGDNISSGSTSNPSTPVNKNMTTPLSARTSDPPPPTPPPSKRARYKVEYNPLHHKLQSDGGWDTNAILREIAQQKQRRVNATVEDLGPIDIEGLGMSLRSRIGSEMSYALTALSMLSMPGIDPNDKGGLGLMHCGELLSDLVDLVEGAAFGEDGWEAWKERVDKQHPMNDSASAIVSSLAKGKWPAHHASLIDLSIDLGSSIDIADDTADQDLTYSANTMSNKERCKITLVGLKLLRNFSMMNDNYKFMCASPAFLNLVGRLADLQLAGDSTLGDDAIFTLADLMRMRKDILQILNNLSFDINLESFPLDTTARFMEVLLSFLDDEHAKPAWHRLNEFGRDVRPTPIPPHIDLAVETLARLALMDRNRLCIRRLPQDDLHRAFTVLVRLLPLTVHDLMRMRTMPAWVEFQARVATSVYNIALLAEPSLRSRMRSTPGVISVLTRVVRHVSAIPGIGGPLAVISRRLGEALGALNSKSDVFNEAIGMTFGANAGVGGWTMSHGESAEPGLLACEADLTMMMACAGDVDSRVFGELDRAIWATEEFAR